MNTEITLFTLNTAIVNSISAFETPNPTLTNRISQKQPRSVSSEPTASMDTVDLRYKQTHSCFTNINLIPA